MYQDYSANYGLGAADLAEASNIGVPMGGATGQVLTKKSAADLDTYWAAAGGGGGGTPGGSSLQLEYNNAGAFGGMSGTSWDDTNRSLTLTGATVTASHPVFDMTQTWNAGAVAFTGLRLNVTNTASAAASKFLDLQRSGNTIFSVGLLDGVSAFDLKMGLGSPNASYIEFFGATGNPAAPSRSLMFYDAGTPTISIGSSGNLNWSTSADAGSPDLTLTEDAANILAQRRTTNAQTLRVYNTFTDASNYERGVLDWTTIANTLTIGAQAAGTGTLRNVQAAGSWYYPSGTLFLSATAASPNVMRITGDGSSGYIIFQSGGAVGPAITTNVVNSGMAEGIRFSTGGGPSWSSPTGNTTGTPDVGITRVAANVIAITTGLSGATTGGWHQWAGQKRVAADVNSNNTTTLATTGLTAVLQAGRTYAFDAYLSFTCTAAQGIRAAIVGTGGLTATAIEYDGYILDSGANGIKGNAQATALGTVVANAATTGTAGVVRIHGTITANVAGNLDVQFAQSVAAANNTTVKRGSYLIVHDIA